jgi:hypothetical protein
MSIEAKISVSKVVASIITAAASAIFAVCFMDSYHDNSNAVTVVTAAFSILAGFVIAVLGLGWDDRVIRARTWRHGVAELHLIKKDLRRHRLMFYLYLAVLALALFGTLVRNASFAKILDFLVLFLSSIALIYSFRLPSYMTRRQLTELDKLIKARRDEETK